MNSVLREYLLKGVFLGLWAYLALFQPDWPTFGRVVAWTAGGLAVGLLAAAVVQMIRGYRPQANPLGFLLLGALDGSFFIYVGEVLGLAVGVALENAPTVTAETTEALQAVTGGAATVVSNPVAGWLGYFAVGGAVLGFLFYRLTQVHDNLWRFALGGVLGAAAVYFTLHYLGQLPALAALTAQERFAEYLLIGVPFFYVLVFCGEADESEVEVAAVCATLGVGLYLLRVSKGVTELGDKLIFVIPVLIYFLYVTRYMVRLRVFKHVLRGFGNLHLGHVRPALASFGKALKIDPRNKLAADGLWALHRKVDVTKLDDQTVGLLNFDFCLDIASALLIKDRAPTAAERAEAAKMLDMVERHKPDLLPRADYLRGVMLTHGHQFDEAAGYLARLLDPETPSYRADVRKPVLFDAWNLALRLHPAIVERLGPRELAKPGRRILAIAAVEGRLAKQPADPTAVELQRELYSGLTEAEFASAAATEPPAEFNYDYVEQLGLALVGEADPSRVERGMAYLRIAGRGLPHRGPAIFKTLADLATKQGDADAARGYLEQVKFAGLRAAGSLPADQRALYVEALKALSEAAVARKDFANAVEDYRLYVEAGKEDANTLRRLAELYVENNDPLNALAITETGLIYNRADKDLLEKKRSYYFSVEVEKVRAVKDKVASWFDVAHCLKEATAVANQKEPDLDTLDYGLHLARLARVVNPASHAVRLAEGRLLLQRGERDAGLSILEDIRGEKRGSGDEEDAWYVATKILGDKYLDELNRPDLALQCFTDFREYQKSGADTLYRIGQAHESLGNAPAAMKSYEAVTAYQNHPRYWDATEAVRRLKGEA